MPVDIFPVFVVFGDANVLETVPLHTVSEEHLQFVIHFVIVGAAVNLLGVVGERNKPVEVGITHDVVECLDFGTASGACGVFFGRTDVLCKITKKNVVGGLAVIVDGNKTARIENGTGELHYRGKTAAAVGCRNILCPYSFKGKI
jgi:hypothetical protein